MTTFRQVNAELAQLLSQYPSVIYGMGSSEQQAKFQQLLVELQCAGAQEKDDLSSIDHTSAEQKAYAFVH